VTVLLDGFEKLPRSPYAREERFTEPMIPAESLLRRKVPKATWLVAVPKLFTVERELRAIVLSILSAREWLLLTAK
jgi:hypothetical protein